MFNLDRSTFPYSQVGFLTGICIPCYTLLYRLIPETKTLLDMCQSNLTKWQSIADEMQAERERIGAQVN